MTILTVQFDRDSYGAYKKLLDAFEASVERNMPSAKFEKVMIDGPEWYKGCKWSLKANTKKLQVWYEYAKGCDDNLVLADCDMLMLRDGSHAFNEDFDIAYTVRTVPSRIPINGGIVMVRPTEAGRDFIRRWRDVNDRMFADKEFHRVWKKKYPGMNQSAFGYLIETGEHNAKLHAYRTREWNAVECDWSKITEDTVFVHYKGKLRGMVLGNRPPVGPYVDAMSLWYEYAGEEVALPLITRRKAKRQARVQAILARNAQKQRL